MRATESHPQVAILTPVFNGERFLDETMRCVQASDYPNLAHVVLDNASTDRTPEIIASYGGRRVPVVTRRNPATIPLCDNLNAVAAMAPATAKYVRLLCADDLIAPTAISRMVEVAERSDDIGVVGCLCADVGNLGSELDSDIDVFPGPAVVRAYLRRETMVLSGTHLLFRKRAFDARRPPYDPTMASCDADCAIRVSMRGSFGFVHEVLATFRHHEHSHSATVATVNGDHLFEWLLLLDRYGPLVMSRGEYRDCRGLYRRYLLRRSLLPLIRNGNPRLLALQTKRLAEIGDAAGPFDFAAALGEWLYFAVSGQRHRVGAPRKSLPRGPEKPICP